MKIQLTHTDNNSRTDLYVMEYQSRDILALVNSMSAFRFYRPYDTSYDFGVEATEHMMNILIQYAR